MGFHKRFVSKDTIERHLKEGRSLDDLFKADAFIFMDGLASDVWRWYEKGLTDEEIKTQKETFEAFCKSLAK